MELLETIITQKVVYKLGWTLLHFIWQAGAVALLLAIVLILLRRASASLRYVLGCTALGLIAVLPVVTMFLIEAPEYRTTIDIEQAPIYETSIPTATQQVIVTDLQVPQDSEPAEITKTEPAAPWHKRATAALEPFLPDIVLFWLAGVFGLSLWHLGGWTQLQRLRKKMVRKVEPSLITKMEQLAAKLGIKRTVGLFESALVQIPTVVGWLKPVILLPASAISGLNSEQLEAVLAHELAHIRRLDYLVNILQTIVEILGFYHPAVWWVSYRIRIERENCCDDLAVGISGDRLRYARALTSLEEMRAGGSELVVAATGGNLFNRIRRLLSSGPNEKIAFNWIPAATAILLLAAILIPAALAINSTSESEQPDNEPSSAQKSDSNTKILIETQILHVTNEFLEQAGLDVDSLGKSDSWTQSRVDNSGNSSMFVIDSQRKEMLLKNVDENEDSSSISHIFLMTTSGKEATIKNYSGYDFKSQELGRFIKIKPDLSQDGEGTYLDCELLIRRFKNFELFYDVYINKKVDQNVVSGSEIAEYKVNAENVRLSDNQTLLILGGRQVSLRDVENRKPVLRHIPVSGEFVNTTSKIEGPKNEIILIKTTVVKPEQNDDIDSRASSYHMANVDEYVQVYLDLDDLEAGQYVEIKDSGQREYHLKQVVTDEIGKSINDFPAYAGYIRFEIRSNFDLNLSTQCFTRGSFFKHDTWDAYFTSPDTITGDGYFSIASLCVCAWKCEIWRIPPGHKADDEVASLVAVIIKPVNEQQEKIFAAEQFKYNQKTDTPVESEEKESSEELDVLVDNSDRIENLKANMLIEMQLISVSEEALKDIETGTNPMPIENGLVLDELRAWMIMQAVQADKRSAVLSVPKVIAQEGKQIIIGIFGKIYSTFSTLEDIAAQKGIFIQFTPDMTDDRDKILLDCMLDIRLPKNLKDINSINDSEYTNSEIETFRKKTLQSLPDRCALLLDGGYSSLGSGQNQKPNRLLMLIKPSVLSRTGTTAAVLTRPSDSELQLETSTQKLRRLGIVLTLFADDNKNKLPDNLKQLEPFFADKGVYKWLLDNVEYLGKGKTRNDSPNTVIAYDITQLVKGKGTNVLFLDAHVEFCDPNKLKEFSGIQKPAERDYETVTIKYIDVTELAERLNELIRQVPDLESQSGVQISPLQQSKQIIIFGNDDKRQIVKQLIAKMDIPPDNPQLSQVQAKITKSVESAQMLTRVGRRMFVYAGDHDDKYPDSLEQLQKYIKDEEYKWALQNVGYLGKDKKMTDRPDMPIAYDKTLLTEQNGTNVFFNDGHIEFTDRERLFETGVLKKSIRIETTILMVDEDFPERVGRDLNLKLDSGTMLYNLHAVSLAWAARREADSKVIDAPRVTTLDNETAMFEKNAVNFPMICGYAEPNGPDEEAKPLVDYRKVGTICELTPHILRDKKVYLDLKLQISQIIGIQEQIFEGKYKAMVPRFETFELVSSKIIPDGETLFIDGGTITLYENKEWVLESPGDKAEKENSFNYKKTGKKKRLLVLFKPSILDWQISLDKDNQPIVMGAMEGNNTGVRVISERAAPPQEPNIPQKSDEMIKQAELENLLNDAGNAMIKYATEHEEKYPDSLQELENYLSEDKYKWALRNIEYLGDGKILTGKPDLPIAFDRKLLAAKQDATNVFFNDGHIEFAQTQRLKEIYIITEKIQMEVRYLVVGEEFYKKIGLDMNSMNESDFWPVPKPNIFEIPPMTGVFSTVGVGNIFLNEQQAEFLLDAVQADKKCKMTAVPKVTTEDNMEGTFSISSQLPFINGYNEPNNPSEEPTPVVKNLQIGTTIEVTPHIRFDRNDILMKLKIENCWIPEVHESIYDGNYKTQFPLIHRTTRQMTVALPPGGTMLYNTGLETYYEQEKKLSELENPLDYELRGVNKAVIILIKPSIDLPPD